MAQVQLDEIDWGLIKLLMEDASRTKVALARELGVSDVTVRNRMERLVDEGVLQIVAIVDPWKVGHRVQIISGIQVEPGMGNQVAEALADLEETTYVSYTTGEYDLVIVAVLRSQRDLFQFLTERLPTIEGIRRIRTNQVLKAIKRTFRYERILRATEEEEPEERDRRKVAAT